MFHAIKNANGVTRGLINLNDLMCATGDCYCLHMVFRRKSCNADIVFGSREETEAALNAIYKSIAEAAGQKVPE